MKQINGRLSNDLVNWLLFQGEIVPKYEYFVLIITSSYEILLVENIYRSCSLYACFVTGGIALDRLYFSVLN